MHTSASKYSNQLSKDLALILTQNLSILFTLAKRFMEPDTLFDTAPQY